MLQESNLVVLCIIFLDFDLLRFLFEMKTLENRFDLMPLLHSNSKSNSKKKDQQCTKYANHENSLLFGYLYNKSPASVSSTM